MKQKFINCKVKILTFWSKHCLRYSLLHNTRTRNPAFVQCGCHSGKWTVIANSKSIGI